MKGFVLGLALKQRRKATQKLPIHMLFFPSSWKTFDSWKDKWQTFQEGLPDLKWLKDMFPDVDLSSAALEGKKMVVILC